MPPKKNGTMKKNGMKRRGPSPKKTRMFPDGRASLVVTAKSKREAERRLATVRKTNRGRITLSPDGFKIWKGAKRKR